MFAKIAVCFLLATSSVMAKAQIGVSKTQAGWIIVGIAASGAAIGIGVYYAVHHGHSLRGCAVSGADGLQLENQGDGQTYALVGLVAAIKPGERVRVSGKKEKKKGSATQQFLVEKLSRDYGPCALASAAP